MSTLWFDCETFSECDLKAHSTHRYAEHPSTKITVAQWALDDAEPTVVDCTGDKTRLSSDGLFAMLNDPTIEVVAHNSAFDRTLLRHCWGIDVPVERWRDTMVKALAHGLPGGLDKVGQVLGLEDDQAKDKRGKELIQLFCKPRPKGHTLRRATRETHPVEWAEFLEYSRQDIIAMRAVDRRLPAWNMRNDHPELALWHLDQKINDRGFAVDLDLAKAAIEAVSIEQARLKEAIVEETDGMVQNASKRDQLLAYILAEYGVDLPDMRADTLRRRLEDPELPEGVKLLLSIRLEATKTSTAKYKALVNATSADGRLRNTLQFAGAQRTARWAGRVFQPQNLPRPTPGFDGDEQEMAATALKGGYADIVFPNVMQLTSNTVRGCIVAPSGKKLVVADLSNIEGRALAFLAGERWKLRAFAEFDAGRGADLYNVAYAKSFGIEPQDVTKPQRQQGKVMELGCLAGDTPVVTNNGVKAIMAVSDDDLLWDGESWVTHEGVITKGVKPVVNVAGIDLTPDHLIATGRTWTQAQEVATNESILSQSLATASANFSSSGWSANNVAHAITTWFGSSAPAGRHHTSSLTTTCEKARAPGATLAQKSNQHTGANTSTVTRTSSLIQSIARGCSIASQRVLTDATTQTTQAFTATVGGASLCSNTGEPIAELFLRTWSRLTAGTIQCLNWIARRSTKATSRATCGSSPRGRTKAIDAKCEIFSNESQNSKPTFDILNSGPRNRFTVLTARGPLIVHNCGYEGGVAAFLTFAAVYGMDLEELANAVWAAASREALAEAENMLAWFRKQRRSTLGLPDRIWIACEVLVLGWRKAHPETKALWASARDAVTAAIENPGQTFDIGMHLKARKDGAWLRIRLPSGRYLCYLQPKVDNGQISYMGVSQYTRQWTRLKTYGGKLIENCTQAFARDVMASNMPHIEAAGYPIVLSVHDELLTETPDSENFSVEELSRLLAARPPWAQGIPLAAAGFECYRYRKD